VDGWEARFEADGELRRWGEDRGGERREIEERAFLFIKIIGWEATVLPNKKNSILGYLLEVDF
jgi:hypothetical protein